jgi:hypothetical protein
MEHIHNFKAFVLNESEDNGPNIVIDTYKKILDSITDLKDMDVLFDLVEGNHLFEGVVENPNLIRKAYSEFHFKLLDEWINNRGEDRLLSDLEIEKYSEAFSKWIKEKGYESQEVFLAYIPGTSGIEYTGDGETGIEGFGKIDPDNLEQSTKDIIRKIKNTEVYNYYRGYFRMGFDLFSNGEEENPGWALFAFKEFSTTRGIEEQEFVSENSYSLSPEDEDPYRPEVFFMPNTSLFYKFNPGGPYGSTGVNPMVDFCTEEGFLLRSK